MQINEQQALQWIQEQVETQNLLSRTLPFLRREIRSISQSNALAAQIEKALGRRDAEQNEGRHSEQFSIRLKQYPDKYIGRKDSTYAILEDRIVSQRIDQMDVGKFEADELLEEALYTNAHWFVPKYFAKIWKSKAAIKRFITYSCGRNASRFSHFELVDRTYAITNVIPWESILSEPNKRSDKTAKAGSVGI